MIYIYINNILYDIINSILNFKYGLISFIILHIDLYIIFEENGE